MARKAPGDEHGATNVVSLARARAARQPLAPWSAGRPDPERVAATALETCPGEAAVLASDGTVLAANRRWLLAVPTCPPGADWFGGWRFDDVDPRDAAVVIPGVRGTLSGIEEYTHDLRVEGTWRTLRAVPLGGPLGGAVVVLEGPSPESAAGDGRDPLTGLATRARLLGHLETLLRAPGDGRHLALLVVGIHDFKRMNQVYGHALGDLLLVEAGHRLEGVTGPGDLVAHVGGDEFAVLTRSTPGSGDAADLATRLATALGHPFTAGTRLVHLDAGIGCRVADPALDESAIELLRDGVAAMREAREELSRVSFFSAETRSRLVRRMVLENDLRLAIQFGNLTVAYQPQVELTSGAVVGAEALVRWRHEEYGQVPPSEFVPLAEASGLMDRLGEWVLRRTCHDLASWKAAGDTPGQVTVNVSTRQLTPRLVHLVREVLAEHDLEPAELCLELTETALMSSPEEGIDVLRAVRSLGVAVALDDFGTGQSSLGMLKALPIDVLKIDRSFVTGLGSSSQDDAIVAAIVALAGALGLDLVAEGVERPAQAACLRALGCRLAQGWLFAPAVEGSELVRLCRTGLPLC